MPDIRPSWAANFLGPNPPRPAHEIYGQLTCEETKAMAIELSKRLLGFDVVWFFHGGGGLDNGLLAISPNGTRTEYQAFDRGLIGEDRLRDIADLTQTMAAKISAHA